MSFEDDAYWESEYTDRSAARSAVSRRPDAPVDELAARRKRRQGRYRRPPPRDSGVQKGFDSERPSWLDDPDFVPTDVSTPDAGHDSAILDFNRPELGGTFDLPAEPRWTGRDVPQAGSRPGSLPGPLPGSRPGSRPEDDWDDEIDEPYDHRAGMDRRSTVRGLNGYVPSPDDWDDDPAPEDWDDADQPAFDDDPLDLYRRSDARPEELPAQRGGPRVVGRATAPRIISQAGPPPVPARTDPPPAPRVLSGSPRVGRPPGAPDASGAFPAVGTAPVSPASVRPVSPPAAATAPVSPPAVGAGSVSSPAMDSAPVQSPFRVPAQPTLPADRPPGPAALPPAQREPADALVAPPAESAPDTSQDDPSGWFAAPEPAAPESTGPEPGAARPTADPQPPSVPSLAPEDLRAVRWRLDGATLREVVDDPEALRELGGRLDGPLAEETDHVARAGLLSLRAEVYRLLGELGMAAAASRLALAHAESARDVHAIVIAQAELAHVLRLRGHHTEADRLLEEAASSEAPELLRSVVHEYAGRSCFDQGRHMEALNHFARAIRLGAPEDLDLVERIDVCLEAVYIHVLRDGWGPYPRRRRDILIS